MEKGKKILQKYISISNHIRDMFLDFSKLKKIGVFFPKNYQNSEKITPKLWRFHSQILLNDFGFGDFSTPHRHVDGCGKIPNNKDLLLPLNKQNGKKRKDVISITLAYPWNLIFLNKSWTSKVNQLSKILPLSFSNPESSSAAFSA